MIARENLKLIHRSALLLSGWKTHAPQEEFSGIKIEEFEQAIQELDASKEVIRQHQAAIRREIARRQTLQSKVVALAGALAKGIAGHIRHGKNSPILRGAGYKTAQEYKSGLTWKTPSTPEDTPLSA